MRKLIFCLILAIAVLPVSAQYKETFDSNSLGWTECAFQNPIGTAVIDRGVMTVKSKGEKKGLSALASAASGTAVKAGVNTFFETHCYAPLNMERPFEIRARVNVKKLGFDRLVGLIFNYRDGGNFYCFSFNDDFVKFTRYVDNVEVGDVMQGIRWQGKRRTDMEWVLTYDGSMLRFSVDGEPMLTIRYMPLSYSGVGFYSFGNQELIVDEIEFVQ